MIFRLLLSVMYFTCWTFSLCAEVPDYVRVDDVILCEGNIEDSAIPSFTHPDCRETKLYKFSPYKKQVWLKAIVDVSEEVLAYEQPLGLFLSGKMASRVYLNGQFLGANGFPATMAEDEIAGKMDAVLYLRSGQVKPGNNEIVIQMSGHHGFIPLTHPIHFIAIGPHQHPPSIALEGYLPSFVPFGILLVGAFYFGTVALYRRQNKSLLLLPLAALFASAQLLAEVSRGLVQYDYPYHDVRLILIVLFAAATGVCLLVHVIDRYGGAYKRVATLVGFVVTVTAIFLEDTFSSKALLALQAPAFVGAIIAGVAYRADKPKALSYALVLLSFVIVIQPVLDAFLDVYFFYTVAALLIFLLAQQARTSEMEKQLLAAERSKAERLQQILDESEEKQFPSVIKVSEAGKVELISADKIIYCKSAADYVELVAEDRTPTLKAGSLTELEKELPSTFLRVHRSYLVNSTFIKSLKREPNGSGALLLTTDDEVPVSRRIMPLVRKALV